MISLAHIADRASTMSSRLDVKAFIATTYAADRPPAPAAACGQGRYSLEIDFGDRKAFAAFTIWRSSEALCSLG